MSKNILDSRDLNDRLEELQTEFSTWKDSLTHDQISSIKKEFEVPENEKISDEEFNWAWQDEVGSDAIELKDLIELREQFGREWNDGVTLVEDSYFETFAGEEAESIGAFIARSSAWPYCCIDWQKAAEQLQMDYSSVEFDGKTYWYRDC